MTSPLPTPVVPKLPWGSWLPTPQTIPVPGLGAVGDLAESLTAARRWIADRHNWVRVSWFAGGVVLVVGGLVVMAAKPAVSAVGTAIKVVK